MENKNITQVVISEQSSIDSNQSVEKVAFFNPDGSPTSVIGQSAYDLAVENGFEGSEEEWLDSLEGTTSPQNQILGATNNSIDLPWAPSPPMTGNLWVVENFQDYPFDGLESDLEPFILADGSEHHHRTRVNLGNVSGTDYMFRLSFNIDDWPEGGGWASIKMHLGPNGSTDGGFGTNTQMIAGASKPYFGRYIFEWSAEAGDGTAYMELNLNVYNNMSSGYLRISDVKLERIAYIQRPLLVSRPSSTVTHLYTQHYDSINDEWKMSQTLITDDDDLEQALCGITGYTGTRIFSDNPADPTLLSALEDLTEEVNKDVVEVPEGIESAEIRIKNNDQIIGVLLDPGDTEPELRCNTHGGETLRSMTSTDLLFQLDIDQGAWEDWDSPSDVLQTIRRFHFRYNTKVETSEALEFANVDHDCYFFPDGMMRMDRTTTFTEDIETNIFLEWMSSLAIDEEIDWSGRIGRGLIVQGELKPDLVHKFAMGNGQHWAVFKEPTTGLCFGNIVDRDAVLSRPEVSGFCNHLQRLSYIVKNYNRLMLDPILLSTTIPSGTVWTATHWSYTYAPSSATDWHLEIATKSVDLEALKLMYPIEPILLPVIDELPEDS